MMKEYEYSYKVKSLKPYIEYCTKNNYILESKNKQQVFLYKKQDKTLARIKINIARDGSVTKKIDFKDEDHSKTLLKIRRESMALEFLDDTALASVLEFLGYKKYGSFIRRRQVYTKNNVIFEIDYYIKSRNKVIAVEGLKEEVDKVYDEIKGLEI